MIYDIDSRKKNRRKRLTIDEVADKMGINRATFYRKLNSGGKNFLIRDVDALVKILHLKSDEATAIFFAQYVA